MEPRIRAKLIAVLVVAGVVGVWTLGIEEAQAEDVPLQVFEPSDGDEERRGRLAIKVADEVMRGKAVETIEHEVAELDNIFGILVLGAFIGIPSPPIHITMELLPLMDKEFDIMLDKVLTAHDPLGHLFSVLGID